MNRFRVALSKLCIGALGLSAILFSGCESIDPALLDSLNQSLPLVVPAEYQNVTKLFVNAFNGVNQANTLKTQQELERQQPRPSTVASTPESQVVQPELKITQCTTSPETITGGSSVNFRFVYQAYGAGSSIPTGTLAIINTDDKTRVASKPLTMKSAGEVEISQQVTFPKAAKSGLYSIVAIVNYGGQEVRENAYVTVQ